MRWGSGIAVRVSSHSAGGHVPAVCQAPVLTGSHPQRTLPGRPSQVDYTPDKSKVTSFADGGGESGRERVRCECAGAYAWVRLRAPLCAHVCQNGQQCAGAYAGVHSGGRVFAHTGVRGWG